MSPTVPAIVARARQSRIHVASPSTSPPHVRALATLVYWNVGWPCASGTDATGSASIRSSNVVTNALPDRAIAP